MKAMWPEDNEQGGNDENEEHPHHVGHGQDLDLILCSMGNSGTFKHGAGINQIAFQECQSWSNMDSVWIKTVGRGKRKNIRRPDERFQGLISCGSGK